MLCQEVTKSSGSQSFTVLDMKSGYHQVEVLEGHTCRAAFTVGPLGFWEFNRLSFSLNNARATSKSGRKCVFVIKA